MKSNRDNVMILSPAGSFEALTAAIQAGANAVYFGVEQLNMRARSANYFTIEDMQLIAHQCKQSNVKAYLTLNTVLYDYDMQLMRRIISSAKEFGIDAVIASDHAAMTYAKSIGIPLHISTQSSVSNIETVDFYSNFADVIVLARELSLKQVAEITREITRRDIKGPSGNLIKIEVRNGPAISVVGLAENEIVEDQIPITINAYGSEGNDVFVIKGSETPKGIPSWVWALVIAFVGFALFYLIMYWNPELYKSFV